MMSKVYYDHLLAMKYSGKEIVIIPQINFVVVLVMIIRVTAQFCDKECLFLNLNMNQKYSTFELLNCNWFKMRLERYL